MCLFFKLHRDVETGDWNGVVTCGAVRTGRARNGTVGRAIHVSKLSGPAPVSLGVVNFTGGLFPDTELPWSVRTPRPPSGPKHPTTPSFSAVCFTNAVGIPET